MHLVHALILKTFIGPRPPGKECLHIDGNPQNNKLSNLRYGTHKENMEDCSKHGGFGNRKGINNSNAKFTNQKAKKIRKLYKKGNVTQLQLAKQFNVGEYAIWCIVNNKTWNDNGENSGK